jgi:hypothetical protein
MLLYCVEPLLCNDRSISKYIKGLSRRRLCKHVGAGANENATMIRQQRKGVFCGPHRDRCYATAR